MLPTFKEVVEELFARGLVKAVFATETLALGINMPARSVVLERLVKWNGETHADITPGEYTQLTGRAGRRGIDVEGHAVVLWQDGRDGVDPRHLAGLASTRTYPLRSSFRPSYNMAVNLVGQVGRHRARELLESSFAQFQADRAVVGLARQVRRNEEALDGYREAMTCHLGDFAEYARLRRSLTDREAELSRRGAASSARSRRGSLERLRPGDVIRVPAGRRAGLAVVLDPGTPAGNDGPRPTVLTADRQVKRLTVVDFPVPVEPLEQHAHSADVQRPLSAVAARPRGHAARRGWPAVPTTRSGEAGNARMRPTTRRSPGCVTRIRDHPCHGCAEREDHARWAERYWRLRRDTDDLERRVGSGRTPSPAPSTGSAACPGAAGLPRRRRGHAGGPSTRPAVHRAGPAHGASACARACGRGYRRPSWLRASRRWCTSRANPTTSTPPRIPGGRARAALAEMTRLWGAARRRRGSAPSRRAARARPRLRLGRLSLGCGRPAGDRPQETDLSPGDFVRWTKQVIDLLDQVSQAVDRHAGSPVPATARAAVQALRRGVVAYSSLT